VNPIHPDDSLCYLNGEYLPLSGARIPVLDRGFIFGDGVYEVVPVYHKRAFRLEPHLDRLQRSLAQVRIDNPHTRDEWRAIIDRLVRSSTPVDLAVYVQVTRGVARRDFAFPRNVTPTVFAMASALTRPSAAQRDAGLRTISVPDARWLRCDIKSVSLLPNILAKQAARESGAYEAWFVDKDGNVTEGGSTNAWIVTKDGELVTRQLSNSILGGITRRSLVKLAADAQIKVVERPFSLEEARGAREAFLTSTTSFVTPITKIDGKPVGTGKPGAVAARLRELYYGYMGSPEPGAA